MSEVNGTTANHGNDNIQSNIESLARLLARWLGVGA